uniref:Ig-like domain-containing protein n=1 Tax=Crocodylus porosus TaxID=8502 RepID=A0A7M4EW00_CROPO
MGTVNMWTPILLSNYGDVHRLGLLKQTQLSITKAESKTIRIECHATVSDFGNAYIHWYRQKPGAPPERILYFSSQLHLDSDSDKEKFNAEKKIDKSLCILTIRRIASSDAATYYCQNTGTGKQ